MGLMKKLTSAVVVSSLVLSAAGTVLAAPSADEQSASYARMEALKLVVGTDRGAELEGELTRAQLLTIIVRAFNQEGTANLLKDLGSFSDVPGGQWYSGYVAVAKNLATERGFAIGYPDGTFQPNKQVSVIEALAMIMKFLGVPTGTGDNWIAQTIENAKAAGVITDADVEKYLSEPNAPATRGVAFALADQIFSTYKVAGEKTVYTYYVDTVAPTLTVTKPANPTTTAATYTVQGIVESGADVYVNGDKATVANGSFSFEVNLEAGENTITVSAVDIAGNVTTETITITRVAGEAAKIVAEDLEVAAGSETELSFKVVDANDLELADAAAEVEVTLSEGIGTYEDGIFKASEKAGKGTITLTLGDLTETIEVTIVPGPLHSVKAEFESVAPGEAVELYAVDEFGNVIEGAEFSENHANAYIEGNVFTATKPGEYTVNAKVGEETKEATILVYGEVEDLVIEVPDEIVANDATQYKVVVKAVDSRGALVRSFNEDVILRSDSADLKITSSAAVKAKDGVAEFKVKAAKAGVYELEAIYDGIFETAYDDIRATAEVEAVKQKAASLAIDADEYLSVGWSGIESTFTVSIADQEGEPMKGEFEGYDVTIRVSGPAHLLDKDFQDDGKSTEIFLDGEETFYLVSTGEEGTVTITATAEGLKEAKAEVKAVYAGSPRKLVIEKVKANPATTGSIYKIGVTDSKGVPVVFNNRSEDIELIFNTSDVKVFYGYADDDVSTEVTVVNRKATIPVLAGEPWIYVKVQDGDASSSVVSNVTVKASATGLLSASSAIEFTVPGADAVKVTNGVETIDPVYGKVFQLAVEPGKKTAVNFQIQSGSVAKKGVYRATIQRVRGDALINGRNTNTEMMVYTDENGKGSFTVQMNWLDGDTYIVLNADLDRNGDFDDDATVIVKATVARNTLKTLDVDTVVLRGGEPTSVSGIYPGKTVYLVIKGRTADRKALDKQFDGEELTYTLTSNEGYRTSGTIKLNATSKDWDELTAPPAAYDSIDAYWVDEAGGYVVAMTPTTQRTFTLTVTAPNSLYQPSDTAKLTVSAEPKSMKVTSSKNQSGETEFTVQLLDISGDLHPGTYTLKVVRGTGVELAAYWGQQTWVRDDLVLPFSGGEGKFLAQPLEAGLTGSAKVQLGTDVNGNFVPLFEQTVTVK